MLRIEQVFLTGWDKADKQELRLLSFLDNTLGADIEATKSLFQVECADYKR